MNTKNNNIRIMPVCAPIYSSGLFALGVNPVISVRIEGFLSPQAHNVSVNVFGLSKAGFFIERTPAFSGEIFVEKDCDCISFNLACVPCRIREDVFKSLKAPVPAKITVEVTIDGVKYMGDSPITLYPGTVYPAIATPAIFSTLLSPFCKDVVRIVSKAPSKNLSGIYSALKSERIIYSVRECDFTTRNVSFFDVNTFFAGRSKMASPIEMAIIFCSCAINMGLYPVIVTLKGKKGPTLLCGISEKPGSFGTVCVSAETIRQLTASGELELINISNLFTGHSVELEDAARNAAEELFSSEMIFALDIANSYSEGAKLCHFDEENTYAEENLTYSFRHKKAKSEKKRTLSEHAEFLTDTTNSSLLNIARENPSFVCVNAINLKSVMHAAQNGEILPLSENSAGGTSFGSMGGIYEACRRLRAKNGDNNELYLACGFLSYNGKVAPIALYPIKLSCKNATASAKFISPKPYCNRLLCEVLKSIPQCRAFFDKIGIPGGDLDDIISCFETLCDCTSGKLTLIKECGVGRFPYRNSTLSFAIVDKFDRINQDGLSSAILSGKTAPLNDRRIPYGKNLSDIELRSPEIFDSTVIDTVSYSSCGDIAVINAGGKTASDISLAVASENIRNKKSTLIIADSAEQRLQIREAFEKQGLSNAVLVLSSDTDIKESIKNKLTALSESDLSALCENDKAEFLELQKKLIAYSDSKSRIYDFEFSFNDAASAYINAGKGLSREEKELHIEPESIFFPDLSKNGASEIFEAQMRLCRAASVLPPMPYKENPFFKAALTDTNFDDAAFSALADNSISELSELVNGCREIFSETGFDISHIKTLPALHSFISLIVLISKEYDKGITSSLLSQDIYSVAKRVSGLRSIASEIIAKENELCEFDRGVFSVDASALLSEWTDGEKKHSDISKTINEYRTNQSENGDKKSVFDVLHLLSDHEGLSKEFEDLCGGMDEIFAGYWNGVGTDWEKISSLVDFTKMADVLLKKIYGTDSEKRRAATSCFATISELCADRTYVASVIGAASLFDKTFSDDGNVITLSKILSADIYNMTFENGVFADGGIESIIKVWKDSAVLIPLTAKYNLCVAECRKVGLDSFVNYLENNPYTPATEKIFTRSLLFLALKQITLYDKNFLSMNLYEKDTERYRALLKDICNYNKKELAHLYVESCVSYIKANSVRANAFSEALADKKFAPEELILRNSETVKTLFPVIVAEPSFAYVAGEADNIIVCGADNLDTSSVLPVLHYGKNKIVISGSEKLFDLSESFASDCRKAGVFEISAARGGINDISNLSGITYMRSPVSSYDKERNTNVLEAQTIGLEIMKNLSEHPENKIQVLTFTQNQCETVYEVLSTISEKSVAVQRAMSDGRINISCADGNSPCGSDVLYISTVFDRDETSGMMISCRENDLPENHISCLPASAIRALSGDASKTVAVFAPSLSKYPNPVGATGASRMALFSEFAYSKGVFVNPDDSLYDEYTVEFADLLSENGFDVYTVDSGRFAAVRIGTRFYGAVIGAERHAPVHEAEALVRMGITPIFIDSTELLLNPHKILDRMNSIRNGGSI